MKKLYFFFPYMDESGVPMLFLRMARFISSHYANKYNIYIIDFEDGAMARNLSEEDNISICEFHDTCRIEFDADSIIIFQSLVPYFWPSNKLIVHPETKIIYWNLHPHNLVPSLLPLPFLRYFPYKSQKIYDVCALFYKGFLQRIAKLVEDMYDHNAIAFMDSTNFKTTCGHLPVYKLRKQIPTYLPVPAEDYNGMLKHTCSINELNMCWLGRICDEKTSILKQTIERASKIAKEKQKNIKFHILGYGEDCEMIDNLSVEHEFFSKEKCRPIKSSEINKYLLNNVDVMFAMGTSALEAAKIAIPTSLVDFSLKSIKGDYDYKFIYMRKNYDLGHRITNLDLEKDEDNDSLSEIVDLLERDYDNQGTLCKAYYDNNHSMLSIGKQFEKLIDKSTFHFSMINPKVIQMPFFMRIYNAIRGFQRY